MVYRYTHNTHDTLTDQTDSPKICERVSERTTPKTERNDKKREVMNQTKRSWTPWRQHKSGDNFNNKEYNTSMVYRMQGAERDGEKKE